MNVKDIRRQNLRDLATQIGGITALSKRLKKSQSQISHLIGSNPVKNIGDRQAAHIEQIFNKAPGWLDRIHARNENHIPSKIQQNETVVWLPIITWNQISLFVKENPSVLPFAYQSIPTQLKLSKKSFAVRVEKKIEIDTELHFPLHSILIVDPTCPVKEGMIIIFDSGQNHFIVERYSFNKTARNPRKPLRQANDNKIIGVIKQLIVNFDQ